MPLATHPQIGQSRKIFFPVTETNICHTENCKSVVIGQLQIHVMFSLNEERYGKLVEFSICGKTAYNILCKMFTLSCGRIPHNASTFLEWLSKRSL